MTMVRIRRALGDDRVIVPLGAITFALIFTWPLLGHLGQPGVTADWDVLMGIKWASWKAIVPPARRNRQVPSAMASAGLWVT